MIYSKLFPILNDAIYRVTGRMRDKTRLAVILALYLLIAAIYFFNIGYFKRSKDIMIYASVVILLIGILSVDSPGGNVDGNTCLILPLSLFSIGMIATRFFHPIEASYAILAIDTLFLFPFLYYVQINSKNRKVYSRLLAIAIIVEGIVAFAVCVVLSLKGNLGIQGLRISGHTKNPNFLGALGLAIIISGLYMMLAHKRNLAFDTLNAFGIGAGIFFMIGGSSRSAILASLGCTVAFLIFAVKSRKYDKNYQRSGALRISIMALIILATFTAGLELNDINQRAIEKRVALEAQQLNEGIAEQPQQEAPATQATSEIEELKRRTSVADKDANLLSSGRLAIWKIYAENFSWFGKETSEIKDSFQGWTEYRAHNNLVDYTFRFGYIVGLFYLLFYILQGITGLKIIFSKNHYSAEDFFLVEIIGCYSLYALVEVASLPFIRIIPCMYFLMIAPIMLSKLRADSQEY